MAFSAVRRVVAISNANRLGTPHGANRSLSPAELRLVHQVSSAQAETANQTTGDRSCLNDGRFGDLRLSTLICWRRTRISASSRALDRNSLISAHAIKMRKSIIGYQHHPIRRMIASQIEFPVETPVSGHQGAEPLVAKSVPESPAWREQPMETV